MSPMSHKKDATMVGKSIESPFVGPFDHTVSVPVDLSALTNKEIDRNGYLKPAVPLTKAGILVTAGAVYGVTIEPIKVAADNADATIAALGTVDIAIALDAQINQDIAEDILERAYTAAELAGFVAAGSRLILS
jgi:hypothetical protein